MATSHNGLSASHLSEYQTWCAMVYRCHNPSHKAYPRYGGRGITVCDRWRMSFADFLEDMGVRPKGMTLERTDNNQGYCKENCRWATRTEQQRNTRRTKFITYRGETKCIGEWAESLNITSAGLRWRIKTWGIEEAFSMSSLGVSRPGEKSPITKLTNEDVLEIRRLHAEGVSHCRLAKMFPASKSAIGEITLRRTWKHI